MARAADPTPLTEPVGAAVAAAATGLIWGKQGNQAETLIRLHLVNLSCDTDLGIYEAESEAQAWEFAREDHPEMLGDRLAFFPVVAAPELMGDASPDAEDAFVRVVRRFVAGRRSTLNDAHIATLVRDHFTGCTVTAAVPLDAPMPWLALHDPAAAASVYLYVSQALGLAEVERVEAWAKAAALEDSRRDAYAGHVGKGASHLYKFVQALGS